MRDDPFHRTADTRPQKRMAPDVVRHLVAKDGRQHIFIGFSPVVLRYHVEKAFENDYFAATESQCINSRGIYDRKFPIIRQIGTLIDGTCDPSTDTVDRLDIGLIGAKLVFLNELISP